MNWTASLMSVMLAAAVLLSTWGSWEACGELAIPPTVGEPNVRNVDAAESVKPAAGEPGRWGASDDTPNGTANSCARIMSLMP